MKTLKLIYEHHTAGLNTTCTMHQQHVSELEAKCTKLQHDLTILQRNSREEIRALMVQVEQLEHQAEARQGRLKRMFREILICEIKMEVLKSHRLFFDRSKYQNVSSQIHNVDKRDQNGGFQISLAYFLTDQNIKSEEVDSDHSDEDDIESVSSSLLPVASSDPVISPRASPAPQSSQPPRSSIDEIEQLLLDHEPEHQDANVGNSRYLDTPYSNIPLQLQTPHKCLLTLPSPALLPLPMLKWAQTSTCRGISLAFMVCLTQNSSSSVPWFMGNYPGPSIWWDSFLGSMPPELVSCESVVSNEFFEVTKKAMAVAWIQPPVAGAITQPPFRWLGNIFSLMAHQPPQVVISTFGPFRVSQGHVPPAIGASNAPSGQKSPDLSQPVAMHYSYRREKRFGYIYNAPCALIEWWKGGEKLTNSIIDIKKKRLLGFRPGPGHV
ncbi:hypothetical protein C8J57DRAFT_1243580 [Mycena rebaudengoi]|nr:hypothetical protein C8J57DRAFT_1243580 [Mycena rebaudengoi]